MQIKLKTQSPSRRACQPEFDAETAYLPTRNSASSCVIVWHLNAQRRRREMNGLWSEYINKYIQLRFKSQNCNAKSAVLFRSMPWRYISLLYLRKATQNRWRLFVHCVYCECGTATKKNETGKFNIGGKACASAHCDGIRSRSHICHGNSLPAENIEKYNPKPQTSRSGSQPSTWSVCALNNSWHSFDLIVRRVNKKRIKLKEYVASTSNAHRHPTVQKW